MAFDAIQISFGELNMKAEEHILKAVQQIDVNVDKEKLIKAIKATDFVDELIYYIFHVQDADDDNLSAELVCRKLLKHGLIDKVDGYYQTHDICTNTHECVKDTHDKTSCDTCKHKGEYAYCRLCGRLSENNYEPKDEQSGKE